MKNIKCVVVGDGSVGKTSLLIQYATNTFSKDYIPTVFDNYTVNTMVDSDVVRLSLWDTAGQEEYDKLRLLSYSNTDVFLLCFSLISFISFYNIRNKWISEVKQNCPNANIILIGTKKDLKMTSKTSIEYSDALKLSEHIGAYRYIECSSITCENIKLIFDTAITSVLNKKEKVKKKKCIIL